MTGRVLPPLATLAAAALICAHGCRAAPNPHSWSASEIATIRSLSLTRLAPLPPDPSNAVADDPEAAELGHRLFFDARLSATGEVSCSGCHRPGRKFTDGRPVGVGVGRVTRNTPTIVGAAYNSWFYWDGRRDTQWAQALTPLEAPAEHGATRTRLAHLVAREYRASFESVFGSLPDLSDPSRFPPSAGPLGDAAERSAWEAMNVRDRRTVNGVFASVGKALAAYERRIRPGRSRFDAYADAVAGADGGDFQAAARLFTADEAAGLRLFIGDAACIQCHNGPLLTNGGFHNIGLPPAPDGSGGGGRLAGVERVLADEFNCLSEYSDAAGTGCEEIRFVKTTGLELVGAFKVPGLRNVADTAPYMHRGQLATLEQVIDHYDRAPEPRTGHSDLLPLALTAEEKSQLIAFLATLGADVDADASLLRPPAAGPGVP